MTFQPYKWGLNIFKNFPKKWFHQNHRTSHQVFLPWSMSRDIKGFNHAFTTLSIFVLPEYVIDVLVQLSYAKRTCKFNIIVQYMLIIFPLGSTSSYIPNYVSRSYRYTRLKCACVARQSPLRSWTKPHILSKQTSFLRSYIWHFLFFIFIVFYRSQIK